MGQTPVCMFLEEVAVCAGHEVLMETDDNWTLIVFDLQRILVEQLRPHTTHL
jgi:hypothetical protein